MQTGLFGAELVAIAIDTFMDFDSQRQYSLVSIMTPRSDDASCPIIIIWQLFTACQILEGFFQRY